ncbi:MAG: hypothetical protein ACC726_00135 [Chloroflexota bacterium]
MGRPHVAAVLLLALILASATAATGEPVCEATTTELPESAVARTDQLESGNRIGFGCGPIDQDAATDIDLGAIATWVLPDPTARGRDWLVALEDGSVVRVRVPADDRPGVDERPVAVLAPAEPPLATLSADGTVVVVSAIDALSVFDDAIPGARLVGTPDGTLVALTEATERYPHGVLGDGFEAASVSVRRPDGTVVRIDVGPDAVVEGLSPILLDLDEDGDLEIVVTVSDTFDGARLVSYDLDGELVASSEPIGQGFRWLHQIGGGPVGPAGETEIVVVRTPHIGGTIEAYRLIDDRLELMARQAGYSSHRIGSANLDMALLADVDADGRLDVVVPSDDMRTLGLLTRSVDGFELLGTLPLDGMLTTNMGAASDGDGSLVLAVGTDDGRLRIFR